jgi:broad specificity phosphatase PhoE
MPTTLYLVRHGEVYNPQDVFYGRMPRFGLSETGKIQAQAASDFLKNRPISYVFSSPLLRARQTAKIILSPHNGLTLKISNFLNEVYTPFDGDSLDILRARHWDVYTGVSSNYEQPSDVLARTDRFIQKLRNNYSGQQIVSVTHRDVILFYSLWVKNVAVTPENKQFGGKLDFPENYPAPASVVKFVYETSSNDERPRLEYIEPDLS